MGYYKKHTGDYYRGDYYRGDLWDDIVSGASDVLSGVGTAATQVKNVWRDLFPANLGGSPPSQAAINATAPATTGTALINRPLNLPALRNPMGPVSPVLPNGGTSAAMATVARIGLRKGRSSTGPTHTAFRHVDQWEVRDRRVMNPLNPHALRRAIRRGRSFQKFAMKQLRLEGIHRKVKGFKKKVGKK